MMSEMERAAMPRVEEFLLLVPESEKTPDRMPALRFGLEQKEGALVADIDLKGPAAKAGIKKGDIIIAFNGTPIREMDQLPLLVAQTPVGSKGELTIIRDGKKISKTVEIGELQDEEGAAPAEDTGSDYLGMDLGGYD